MFVSGQVTPDAKVRLSLNGRSVAEGQASHGGRVTFDVKKGAQPGDYRVRLDEVDHRLGSTKHTEANFTVPSTVLDGAAHRVEQTGTAVIPQVRTSVMSQGDNLSSVSRGAYARGPSYTFIFGANRQDIRDPNKNYPKQVFVIPASEDAARQK
jgi:hypothetical protein